VAIVFLLIAYRRDSHYSKEPLLVLELWEQRIVRM
jgi:hypothetical protein